VTHIDKKQIVIMLSLLAMIVMISSLAYTAYVGNASTTTGNLNISDQALMTPGLFGCGRGGPRGRGGNQLIEVSAEYNQTVTNILNNDTDIENLLSEGYNISSIRPVIKTVVQGDDSVVQKATTAIVLLEKDTTARAAAYVDITNQKVTRIVILTETVIDKS
jgi:hypothetical protein